MLKILLTNDDGFHAEGLQILYNHLFNKAMVTIVAPDRERSAVGHGITMHQPLMVNPISINGTENWIVNGTPADCVKLGLESILKETPPDLVISGINRGPNLGNDILYSGTVSAAVEGFFYQFPSIAVSLAESGKSDFNPAAAYIAAKLETLAKLAVNTVLNINFPSSKIRRGKNAAFQAKFTKLGKREYRNVFERRIDPRGRVYFWMGGEAVLSSETDETDVLAVEEGYVSITPLRLEFTDYRLLENLKSQAAGLNL